MADRRLKANIRDLENTLERIVKLPLKRYDMKDNSGPKIGQQLINFRIPN